MVMLIPSRASSAGRMTSGERRFFQRLEENLDDEYLYWYDVPIRPRHRHPDFIVLHPYRGILVLEVKNWKHSTIAELDPDRAVLHTESCREVTSNPLRQARTICIEVGKLMLRDAALHFPEGHKHAGKLIMPWGFGVVLSNTILGQFDEVELGLAIPGHSVLCRDEMSESADTEAFQKRLWDTFPAPFNCQLSLPQIERVRWHLFPQLRITPPDQVQLFTSQPEAPIAIPDLIKMMDLQQEQLARSLGDGHRVIHGVAGSGKTMILGYHCVEIAKRQGKPVLMLCYKMVDSEINALLLYDDAQTIYSTSGRRKFSFASVGIQAKGRTIILRLNYRNTLEILATTKAFTQELVAGEDTDEDHVPVVVPERAGRRGAVPELIQAGNIWDEAQILAQRIQEFITDGASANDFAVLCRSKTLATDIASRLGAVGLPVVLADEGNKQNLLDGEPSVKVLTMHSSKGLKFESVFIPCIREIGKRIEGDSEEMKQEAKLLYVAMTRVLGSLTMLHQGSMPFIERIWQVVAHLRARLAA